MKEKVNKSWFLKRQTKLTNPWLKFKKQRLNKSEMKKEHFYLGNKCFRNKRDQRDLTIICQQTGNLEKLNKFLETYNVPI